MFALIMIYENVKIYKILYFVNELIIGILLISVSSSSEGSIVFGNVTL